MTKPIVIAYARFSTSGQKEASIEDQLRNCRSFAERQGWIISATYQDKAISGATTDRPGFERMWASRFDILLVDDLSRLSRDTVTQLVLLEQAQDAERRVIAVSDMVDTARDDAEMTAGIRGVFNKLFLKDLSKKTKRGMVGVALKGGSTGGRAYAYRSENGRLVIVEEEAEVIRQIFTWYADGWSSKKIARKLNQLGIPSARGGRWNASAIHGDLRRGVGLLCNELYIGRKLWGRREWRRQYDERRASKRVSRQRDESDWITLELPELRILSQGLWDRAQAQLKARSNPNISTGIGKTGKVKNGKFLFSGILRCGQCGSNYVVADRMNYQCGGYAYKGICSNKQRVRRQFLELALLDAFRDQLFTLEHILGFQEKAKRVAEVRRRERRRAEMAAGTRLIEVEKEIANIVAAIKAGILTPTTKAELEACEAEHDRLKNAPKAADDIERLAEELVPLAERYRQALAGFMKFEDDDIPALRALVTAVCGGVVRLSADADGNLCAEVRGHYRALWMTPVEPGNRYITSWSGGELPNKLALYGGKKRLVAGTCNQRILWLFEQRIPRVAA